MLKRSLQAPVKGAKRLLGQSSRRISLQPQLARSNTLDEEVAEFNQDFQDLLGLSEAPDSVYIGKAYSLQAQNAANANEQASYSGSPKLSHTDDAGSASMVNVGPKAETQRVAIASARVYLGQAAFTAVKENNVKKGDVLSVAKIAGIMAAKQTPNLIPLCHSLVLDKASVELQMRDDLQAVDIISEARCTGRTGVEMEAMTAASVAALTVYDMCKAVSKGIQIRHIQLEEKSGGKSGHWKRELVVSKKLT